jgi:hypothetical protein
MSTRTEYIPQGETTFSMMTGEFPMGSMFVIGPLFSGKNLRNSFSNFWGSI